MVGHGSKDGCDADGIANMLFDTTLMMITGVLDELFCSILLLKMDLSAEIMKHLLST